MAKIIPSIYRIDEYKVRKLLEADAEYRAEIVHQLINAKHQGEIRESTSTAKPYHLISSQEVGRYRVAVYGTRDNTHPHPWTDLFPVPLEESLYVQYPNLAAFFSADNECYAISSGMGHTLFEQFIDVNFPLEAAGRIMSPKLDSTTERAITGSIYGRQQQFRNSQLIVSSQSLGTIWQAIAGQVTDEVKASGPFVSIFEPDKSRIGVEAGSSLKIRRSIEVSKFADLLDWLERLAAEPLTAEQEEAFRFLEGLREVSSRKDARLIEDIKQSLADELIVASGARGPINFDFSHKNFAAYQNAISYRINSRACATNWTTPPNCREIFDELMDAQLLDTTSPTALLECLQKNEVLAEHENEIDSTKGSVLSHLHGEIGHGRNTFFLIDGKYYWAHDDFITRVRQDFEGLLVGQHFVQPRTITFEAYASPSQDEGDYNEGYIGKDGWLVADRVFMDNVEIADLLHWNGDELFIVHNKIGFGVTVRDVCSQILLSMQIMNRAKDSANMAMLGAYYDRIKTKYYDVLQMPIAKQAFIDKILQIDKSKITYIIGYGQPTPVSGNSRSNIAKFEAIKLCTVDSRAFDFGLKIMHISR